MKAHLIAILYDKTLQPQRYRTENDIIVAHHTNPIVSSTRPAVRHKIIVIIGVAYESQDVELGKFVAVDIKAKNNRIRLNTWIAQMQQSNAIVGPLRRLPERCCGVEAFAKIRPCVDRES